MTSDKTYHLSTKAAEGYITILEFPDLEAVQRFYNSDEYGECRALRETCSTGRVAMFEATAGEAPIPDYLKGAAGN